MLNFIDIKYFSTSYRVNLPISNDIPAREFIIGMIIQWVLFSNIRKLNSIPTPSPSKQIVFGV
jgi:hypothetical protein